MPKAKRLPSGAWRVRVYLGVSENGKKEYKSFTNADKKQAEYEASQCQVGLIKTQEDERKTLQDRKNDPLRITVGEAIDEFIDNRAFILSPPTIHGYRGIRRNRFPAIMGIKVHDLRREDVQKAVNEDAKKLTPKTIRNTHVLLATVLGIYHPKFELKTTLPGKAAFESGIPEDALFQEMLLLSHGSLLFPAIVLATCLGLRRSELSALEWSDFETENMTVRINKAMVRNEKNEWVVKKKRRPLRVLDASTYRKR